MNYHSDKTSANSNGILEAFKHTVKVCKTKKKKKKKKIDQMAIAIHTKDQLKNNTVEEALGTNNVRILYKNNRGTFQGIEIFIITERIDPADFSEGPALAIDISLAFLEKLANNRRITDLIYKPWSDEELEKYLDSFESYLI